jgi:fibronectin type 3 domain-containing protein
MRKAAIVMSALVIGFSLVINAPAADKDAIKKQVDDIVEGINHGKMATDFMDAAHNEPYYVFIMKTDGSMLVHPSLVGQSLKEKAGPVYDECVKATDDGNWVGYIWKEKQKHTYVRKAKGDLIVGSGYSE